MKASQTPLFTVKEDPNDAQVSSHRLLVRAGFIRKQSSGFYTFLPFGWDVHRKIEQIIREQMNHYGGVEVHLPIITPAELWQRSGRYQVMGPEMMRLKDRHDIDQVLGPTHEEAITTLASTYLQSYKQLPLNLYQIGTKYRDEIRPRYGLIRCREFVMKDAYSFHLSDTSLDDTYQKMRECYRSIFERCSLETIPVEADSGAMGGSGSEEFMVASEVGEETLLLCEDDKGCGYRSNQEKTEFLPAESLPNDPEPSENKMPELVHTPETATIEEVARFLAKDPRFFIKAVITENEDHIVLAFLPGHRELSETKLAVATGLTGLEMASDKTIEMATGAAAGYAGPYELPVNDGDKLSINNTEKTVKIVYDRNLRNRSGLVGGGNKTDYHFINLSEGQHFQVQVEHDLVEAYEGDLCPECKEQRLLTRRGIEVGHIFKLGKKYTDSLELTVLDENGKAATPTMGCYGIGVGRTLSTVVEQHHDDHGLVWPEQLAPYKFYLLSLTKKPDELLKIEELYQKMKKAGISVFYDDRPERAGVKFNDADLTGMPYQLIAGKSFLDKGLLELKERKTMQKQEIDVNTFFENFS